MSEPETKTRRWKRVEYDRLIELGFFRPGDPVELLGGHLIVAEPQGSGHFADPGRVSEPTVSSTSETSLPTCCPPSCGLRGSHSDSL